MTGHGPEMDHDSWELDWIMIHVNWWIMIGGNTGS